MQGSSSYSRAVGPRTRVELRCASKFEKTASIRIALTPGTPLTTHYQKDRAREGLCLLWCRVYPLTQADFHSCQPSLCAEAHDMVRKFP